MEYTSFIRDATERYMESRAYALDQALFTFLREQAVTYSTDSETIKKILKEKNLELVREFSHGKTEETHTFKLCRVFAQTTIKIPKPQFNTI